MTWPPDPQPPCAPDCTCRTLSTRPYTPVPRRTPTCVCCAPPEATARWIAATDPAPVEAPPRPGFIDRILNAARRTT